MIRVFPLIIFWLSSLFLFAQGENKPKYDVFSFEKEVILPGDPEIIFDAVTGDISLWWDHSFSDNPKKLYLEPKPGGGFWEIFGRSR